MGRTLDAWATQVQRIVKDGAGLDVTESDALDVGVRPALAQFSIDRPRRAVIEAVGDTTAYVALPDTDDGWVPGFSWVDRIEYPARENPPVWLDAQSWELTRSVDDVDIEQVVLYDARPAASEHVRVVFFTSWPTPDQTAATDKVDDVGFHAVTHLAASLCLHHLAAEAARSRSGALPTAFVDGDRRSRELREQAKAIRSVYDSYLGRAPQGSATGAGGVPVSRVFDYDPSYLSLFHGKRR
jgi:hypothetical protein